MNSKPQFILSPETKAIIKRLSKLNPGELVPYKDLNLLAQLDVQDKGRYLLVSARRWLLKNEQKVYKCIINEGVARLTASELAKHHIAGLRTIRSKANRTRREQLCAASEELNENEYVQQQTGLALLHLIGEAAKPKEIQRIQSKITPQTDELTLKQILNHFTTTSPGETNRDPTGADMTR